MINALSLLMVGFFSWYPSATVSPELYFLVKDDGQIGWCSQKEGFSPVFFEYVSENDFCNHRPLRSPVIVNKINICDFQEKSVGVFRSSRLDIRNCAELHVSISRFPVSIADKNILRGRISGVSDSATDNGRKSPIFFVRRHPHVQDRQVSSDLLLADDSSDIDCLSRRPIRLPGEAQSPNQKTRTNPDKYGGQQGVEGHSLSGHIHGLRGRVHALLGGKIVLLVLAGFGFAALSGLEGFIVFDDLNRNPKRQIVGRLLLAFGPILTCICLHLGLP